MEKNQNKKPEYAVVMGKGRFAGISWVGANWQCVNCGKTYSSATKPSPMACGRCPDSSSGNHMWVSI